MTKPCFCGDRKTKLLYLSGIYRIEQCLTCGQVRIVSSGSTHRVGYYQDEDVAYYVEKQDMFRRIFREKLAFIRRFKQRGTLLDIGAGVGLFVDEARSMGYDAVGVEPSGASVRAARKHLGVSLQPGEFHKKYFKTLFDIVLMNHVLEHMEDPKRVLGEVRDVLSPQGVLVIGVPNFGSFLAWFKRDRWQSLIPDEHRWQFTLQTLDQLVVPFGFGRVGVSWENHDRSMLAWWKQVAYRLIDMVALFTGKAEAMLVVYQKSKEHMEQNP
ncbi:hypothetical protein A2973_04845 [Candidatus Gottesmanbacteria bacterium RIFCSPLOWO2_01_FULL_49_10]|uniref:Methyltransferase type 11 domain-containing protein n=1 Tax=Candidatus Gottesmanbacteria bacterium RIFCSPLOWO2_01_FULL_49_10 TaxID=1798396 RepID=A0A1F6AYW1_9BACT|nr:MAG: hypothetical protein A2973_04845 [Candidatus Gottesmanbacteria bacterium RIFCSPLOWO2_01_FULL_49_10]